MFNCRPRSKTMYYGKRRLAMSITARIMGLLLAAVAMQFMLNAVRQLNPAWFPTPA
jgi:small neutral amino acid transporter SnatA (MarC family)